MKANFSLRSFFLFSVRPTMGDFRTYVLLISIRMTAEWMNVRALAEIHQDPF